MPSAPAIIRRGFIAGSEEAKSRDLVQSRCELTNRRYAGANETFRQLNRYYLSLSPRIVQRDNDRARTIRASKFPDLFVSRSFTAIEAAVPPWVFSVLGGVPPVKVFARKDGYQEQADAVEAMISYDWERSKVLYRSLHVAKQMFKYGTGVAKIGYRYDSYDITRHYERTTPTGWNRDGKLLTRTDRIKKKETVVRFDGPWLEPVSIYNVGPDPYYNDIEQMRYFWIRRWTDRQTLEWENENHIRFAGKPLYKHLDRIPIVGRGFVESVYQMDHGDDLDEAMGWSGAFNVRRNNQYQGGLFNGKQDKQRWDDIVEVVEYWDREDKVIYLANGETPILDDENPFDDKELPFVAARCHVLDGQFFGYGYLHPIKRSQEELNSHRNLFMRQGQLNVMNLWGYDENLGLPATLEGEVEPGSFHGIHFSANGNPLVRPLIDGRPLPPEAYQIEDRIDRDIQMTLALPNYQSGVQSSKDVTATAANLAAANVEVRNKLMALGGELTYATEIARFFHSRRQQFLKDEGEVFRILGNKGAEYHPLKPGDIAGEFDFVTAGGHLYASKDVLRQQLIQLWTVIKGDPVMLEMTKLPELWEETFKTFDFQLPKRFVMKPPERTYDQEKENAVMAYGQPEVVEPQDNHEVHLQSHMQAMTKAIAEGNPKAIQAFKDHIAMHQRMLQMTQAAAPPQEQTGPQGQEGQVPNFENAGQNQASLQSSVGGTGMQI